MSFIRGLISYNIYPNLNHDFSKFNANNSNYPITQFNHLNKNGVYVSLAYYNRKKSPNCIIYKNIKYNYIFDGVIDNCDELSKAIKQELGYLPIEKDDYASIAAWSYILWGGFSPSKLFGKFSYAIYSEAVFDDGSYSPKLFLARDRAGTKPLYYTSTSNGKILFSSSVSAILTQNEIKPTLGREGLWQALFLGGNTAPGRTLFEGIYEIEPGACAYIDCRKDGLCSVIQKRYYALRHPSQEDFKIHIDQFHIENDYVEDFVINREADVTDLCLQCVEICESPVFLNQIFALSNKNDLSVLFSRVGSEIYDINGEGHIRSFFPWISDPYAHIEYFKKEISRPSDGFNWLFDIYTAAKEAYSFDEDKDVSEKRIKMCMQRFINIPCRLKYVEKLADHYSVSVSYPFASNDLFEHTYYTLGKTDEPRFNVKYFKKVKKDSGFDDGIKRELYKIISNPENRINYLIDREKVKAQLEISGVTESIELMYLFHLWLEKFDVEIKV